VERKSWVDSRWFERLLEIIPGSITWFTLVAPIIFSIFNPIIVAYFIIAFDLYWLTKSFRLSFYLIRGYITLFRNQRISWQKRYKDLDNIPRALAASDARIEKLVTNHPEARHLWGSSKWRAKYREEQAFNARLRELIPREATIIKPDDLYNAVIIATYNESREILEPSVLALLEVDYPLDHLILIIAYEERGGEQTRENAHALIKQYGPLFAHAEAIEHPAGILGEVIGKGPNITYAGRKLQEYCAEHNIDPENVIVTTLDSDNRVSSNYFPYLSYEYATNINRVHKSYQPVPMFYNNIWDVPAPMRVIATGSSFWMIMESMRPHRLRNFSAHAQGLKALIETDFWSTTTIVEDGHQFWRSYFTFDGDHQVVPLFTPVYQDAVLAAGYLRTFKEQFIQLRRWAWGISDFPFIIKNSITNKRISWWDKLVQLGRFGEGHFSWATAPLLLTFVASLPLYLNRSFSNQILAHELPVIASRILTVSVSAMVITAMISLISLPPRPPRYRRTRFIGMILQWVLLPVTAIVFSAIPAITAQTILMSGKSLNWKVTEKAVKK
jgi:hypothetical protein